uniref:Uncharacterized protein n=1 Tax=viral metagenome TaxID=1070528 RepID=A0A6M3J157_9ZZZZ
MIEFLLSDEFSRYRKKQIEAIVKHIDIFTNVNVDEMRGMLSMARILIKLPGNLTDGNKAIEDKIKEDIKDFQVRFIKSHLVD